MFASINEIVGTNTTYLSGAVNSHFGCNLKTLVNRYRIEYAKRLLRARTYCIRDIPRLCGFASRSAFYASFQKIEETTPLHYLIEHSLAPFDDDVEQKQKSG